MDSAVEAAQKAGIIIYQEFLACKEEGRYGPSAAPLNHTGSNRLPLPLSGLAKDSLCQPTLATSSQHQVYPIRRHYPNQYPQ
jgi:hypothetical protein